MSRDDSGPQSSWFGDSGSGRPTTLDDQFAFGRLWHAFMTARAAFALVLFGLFATIHGLSHGVPAWLVAASGGYALSTIAYRFWARPLAPGAAFSTQWLAVIGVDVAAFSVVQSMQAGGINFTPLFALPVLISAVMGSQALTLATTAVVAGLLLIDAWPSGSQTIENSQGWTQAVLTISGLSIVAFLTNQLSGRLSREELAARRNRMEAQVQTLVNELVIQHLSDGVLVVDGFNRVRAANPAARLMLGPALSLQVDEVVGLDARPEWLAIADLAQLTFATGAPQSAELVLQVPMQSPLSLQARTQLTFPLAEDAQNLCVMFLQDLREMQARVRTEKLASMGRMSAAVAHEIRNPLAAIAQANALLEEDLQTSHQKRLSTMIGQNAQRLSAIVDEVLDIASVQRQADQPSGIALALDEPVREVCADWVQQHSAGHRVEVRLRAGQHGVLFAPEHLRRVLVNLLDNAWKHASRQPSAIVVETWIGAAGPALSVWSDGRALEQTVQAHLFEPFFSSASRSSGLGLYICRELCQRHGASIGYERVTIDRPGGPAAGNRFTVLLRPAPVSPAEAAPATAVATATGTVQ